MNHILLETVKQVCATHMSMTGMMFAQVKGVQCQNVMEISSKAGLLSSQDLLLVNGKRMVKKSNKLRN